jgi:hypothetical protein
MALALSCLSPAACAAEKAIDKEVLVSATLEQAWQAWDHARGHRELLCARRAHRTACGRRLYACFNRAWGQVLAGLKTCFEKGPMDWGPGLKQLEAYRAPSAQRAASAPAR